GTLGAINITSSVSVALGPVLGGFLAARAGWPAIFLVNVPITAVGLILAMRWLPADVTGATASAWKSGRRYGPISGRQALGATASAQGHQALPSLAMKESSLSRLAVVRAVLRLVDVPGIVLFSGMLASLLAFLLSLSRGPLWPLLLVALIATALLVRHE